MHLEHLAELEEKIRQVHAYIYRVHAIIAITPSRLIFATSVDRQVGEGIF
jgi:hypothetical protein